VIVDVMVVGPSLQQAYFGRHIELAFSTAKGVAGAWLVAMGMDEEDEVPDDFGTDAEETAGFLRRECKGAVIFAEVIEHKNNKGYKSNRIENLNDLGPSEISEGDYVPSGASEEVPF
jgi:hypothetical protein